MTTTHAPGLPRPRRRDAVENRERILEAAVRVIAADGVNVPLATIAAEAQTGIATFYRSFPDRGALLLELGHRSFALLNGLVDQVDAAGVTGLPAIEQYLMGSLQIGDRLVLPLNGGPPLDDETSNAGRRRLHGVLRRYVEQARAQGAIAGAVEAMDIVVCGALVNQPVRRRRGWDRLAARQVQLFVAGLTTGRPIGPPPEPVWDIGRLLDTVRDGAWAWSDQTS